MHQPIRQRSIRGENQQTGCVDVQPTNRHPALPFEQRQVIENRIFVIGIISGADLTRRLVVKNVAMRRRSAPHWLAIDHKLIV